MNLIRVILIGTFFLVAAGIGWTTFDWYRAQHMADSFGDPFTLVDHNGEEITEAAFRGSPSAVFFGFTFCPEVCPTTLYELDGWLAELGEETENVNAYFVSVDPERDTPEVLNSYVSNVSAGRITGITGEPDKIEAMAKSFGIYVQKVALSGDDYTLDHTASILLLDEAGEFAGTIGYGENPDTAKTKLLNLASGA